MDLKGKKALIFGVANKRSIAYGIASQLKKAGCELAFTYAGEALKKRVIPISEELEGKFCVQCDVTKDDDIKAVAEKVSKEWGKFDYLVHSVAFAPQDELKNKFIETTREGFKTALDISAYSLIALAREFSPLMNEGGSIVTMTYHGSTKVIKNYNIMGVAKAALECSVRYLAVDLGERGIRINAISAGPIKTLAAAGVAGFRDILHVIEERSPLHRNVTIEDVGNTAVFLLSDAARGITGEIVYVDSGYNILGM
ncbi:enoyl-ACP reductase FabI [Thermotomaculum hydrothermale]|uniref:enoyl-ACP reductase FabI n=1 Tax=Thermotomaculum hydrothermale TaxID=981385 RepID=UPI0038B4CA17